MDRRQQLGLSRGNEPADFARLLGIPISLDAVTGAYSQTTRTIGALSVGRLASHSASATIRLSGCRSEPSQLLLILCLQGGANVRQAGLDCEIEQGGAALVTLDRASHIRLSGRHLIARCAASAIIARSTTRQTRLSSPVRANGLLTTLARSLLLMLHRTADTLSEDESSSLQSVYFDLAAKLLDQREQPAGKELPSRIRDVIEANLADPELSPATIAAASGTSVRGLYRHFVGLDVSVCAWIKHRRLERCLNDLRDDRMKERTITEIAFRWGFNDPAHFSRTFKERYGAPPRAFRGGLGLGLDATPAVA